MNFSELSNSSEINKVDSSSYDFDARVSDFNNTGSEKLFNPDERIIDTNYDDAKKLNKFVPDGGVITNDMKKEILYDGKFDPDERIEIDSDSDFEPEKNLEPDLSYEEKVKLQDAEIEDIEKKDLNSLESYERGNYGEMKVDQDMRSKGYERISVDMVTDRNATLRHGIDGTYYKADGEPKYAIVDAKFNSAQLGMTTLDGKQMCAKWIDNRLDLDVGKNIADQIRMEKLINPENVGSYVGKVDMKGNVTYEKLDANANEIKGASDL